MNAFLNNLFLEVIFISRKCLISSSSQIKGSLTKLIDGKEKKTIQYKTNWE